MKSRGDAHEISRPAKAHDAAAVSGLNVPMFRLPALAPRLLATAVRLLASTWRIRLQDDSGLSGPAVVPPVIWVLWHNRLLIIPILYERLYRHRKGAALISRSRDGAILARCIECFGGVPVRGSSSRGGATALAEMKRKMAEGYDAYITPDGPRGPRYSVAPGVLWLAQATHAPLLQVSMECSRAWRLGRWDGFFIPQPFAKIEVTLRPLYEVTATPAPEDFTQETERLRRSMMSGTKTL